MTDLTQVCPYCLTIPNNGLFTDDHIIPQFLGGPDSLINRVCKPCNDMLGSGVEGDFTKNILIKNDLGYYFDAKSGVVISQQPDPRN